MSTDQTQIRRCPRYHGNREFRAARLPQYLSRIAQCQRPAPSPFHVHGRSQRGTTPRALIEHRSEFHEPNATSRCRVPP
ncbi:hypothetical protein AMJ86_05275 [bacterium SM23_57]|nr:MAG: hypothetical protein AMJ86_05275 [bacterium SM23_57]